MNNSITDIVVMAFLALSILVLGATVTGCGNQALQANQEVARMMLEVQSTSGPVIRQLRIDASIAAGREVQESGGQESAAQVAASETAQRWQCALDGHGIYATAVSAYIDTLTLWQGGQDFELLDVLPFVRRAIDSYSFLVSCLASLGSDLLPEVPAFFSLIPSTWSLTDVGN